MTDPAHLAATLEAIPYALRLGVEANIEDGRLITSLPFRAELVGNPLIPALHGGLIGAFMEIAALLELCGARRLAAPETIGVTVEYLRPAAAKALHACADVRRLGRRIVNVQVEAWQDDPKKLVALLHGRFSIGGAASAD